MEDDKPNSDSGSPEKDAAAYLASGFLVGGGRFTLLRELGRGGMGLVWLAHDERLTTPVALKFLPEKVRANPVALTDLRQETHKSRMLSHPNILRIYDLYEAPDEAAFISMEYVDGPSLWALLSRQPKGVFTWDYLKPILKQLCEALDYAHGERVVHRDLKPANMLLDDRQRLRLADFGIADWLFESHVNDSERHQNSGTPAYMSPQQIDGQPPRATDDIYALGATLYELLSGHPPFYENDIVYQVRNVLATPLSERLADLEVENEVPPAVAALIMACLSKDPDKRPQSARAVAEWIGLMDSTVAAAPAIASTVFIPAEAPAPPRQSKPLAEISEPPPVEEDAGRRRVIMLLGALGIGAVTWLAWSHFIPQTPNFPAPVPPPMTNVANAIPTNASPSPTNAPVPAPRLVEIPAPAAVGNNLTAAPVSGTSVSIELGAINQPRGLVQITGPEDGQTTSAIVGGKACRLLASRPRGRCYFQISSAVKHPGLMNARIQVEYFAAAPGVLQIQFDGTLPPKNPHYANGGRKNFNGDGRWETAYFQINDAVFRNGEKAGADFRLTTSSHALYIHSVTVFFD